MSIDDNPGLSLKAASIDAEFLVRENIQWMLALARSMLRDRDQAEDALQDAFIAVFRGLDNFAGRPSLRIWMHATADRVSVLDHRYDEFANRFRLYRGSYNACSCWAGFTVILPTCLRD